MRRVAAVRAVNRTPGAGRSAAVDRFERGGVLTRGGALPLVAVAAVRLSARAFRSYRESVRGRAGPERRRGVTPPRGHASCVRSRAQEASARGGVSCSSSMRRFHSGLEACQPSSS